MGDTTCGAAEAAPYILDFVPKQGSLVSDG